MTFDEIYSWVKDLPIIDWHNHLDPEAIAEDRPFGSLYEVWVKPDPYKHRAMRICGVPERFITGDAGATGTTGVSPVEGVGSAGTTGVPPVEGAGSAGTTGVPPVGEDEKWGAWMRTLPQLVGSPLFVWARMELEALGLDPDPYLHGKGENVSLASWTPSRLLAGFNVEWMSPCVDCTKMERLSTGETPVVPVGVVPSTGKMPVVPERGTLGLGQRASRPLTWSPPLLRVFTSLGQEVAAHFSHTLSAGESHRRNLPHIAQSATLVFVTFRLGDSLPAAQLAELEERRRTLDGRSASSDELREQCARIDAWLDAGHGSCVLADAKCRKIVEEALQYFDASNTGTTGVSPVDGGGVAGTTGVSPVENVEKSARPRYRLHAYIVMPNHVHVLFELFNANDLPRILHGWKSYTAKAINQELGTTGIVWHAEYYDRLIRDGEHYLNVIRYLRKNETAAVAIARKRREADVNGQDARCPSGGDANGQDARCTSKGGGKTGITGVPPVEALPETCIVPSLRMNAGERVPMDVLERFHAAGCRIVDISVDDEDLLDREFDSLSAVAAFAKAHGWTMLLHLGALRTTSDRLRQVAGPAGGYAGMRSLVNPAKVAKFLNRLERNGQDARCPSGMDVNGQDARCPSEGNGKTGTTGVPPVVDDLPRTILMTLNPEAHAQLAVLAGSFVEDGMPGKVQLGPAWWWCDHREGIFDVLEKNAAYGVLSTFIGMTTDSRSFLSFVRHDYFRRLLARWMAQKVKDGDFPADPALLRPICEGIAYRNARDFIIQVKERA